MCYRNTVRFHCGMGEESLVNNDHIQELKKQYPLFVFYVTVKAKSLVVGFLQTPRGVDFHNFSFFFTKLFFTTSMFEQSIILQREKKLGSKGRFNDIHAFFFLPTYRPKFWATLIRETRNLIGVA